MVVRETVKSNIDSLAIEPVGSPTHGGCNLRSVFDITATLELDKNDEYPIRFSLFLHSSIFREM
jgi:hypothetical protein